MTVRVPCGRLVPTARKAPEGGGMDISEAFALLAEFDLHDVEELDRAYSEAQLRAELPLA